MLLKLKMFYLCLQLFLHDLGVKNSIDYLQLFNVFLVIIIIVDSTCFLTISVNKYLYF